MLEAVDAIEARQRLAVRVDGEALPDWECVCDLERLALARWGVSRTASVTLHVRATLEACGIAGPLVTARVREAVELLCALGDARAVWVAAAVDRDDERDLASETGAARGASPEGRMVAPTVPRAVDFGEALLLAGCADAPGLQVSRFGEPGGAQRVARWVRRTDAASQALEDRGVEIVAPDDWLGPSSVLDHLERRGVRERSAGALWGALGEVLAGAGGPVDDPEALSVLTHQPGAYWGDAKERRGRWRPIADAPDGLFLGALTGGFGKRMRPVIGEKRGGGPIRVMELFDLDELWWAALGRAAASGRREQLRVSDGSLQLSCMLPREAQRLRSVCSTAGWRWAPPEIVSSRLLGEVMAARFDLLLHD